MVPLEQALQVLHAGGVIAHATETCYGFACDAFSRRALARLYKIKKMPRNKPVSLLVADIKMAKKYAVFSPLAKKLAKQYWPGPLTLVLKRKKTLPDFLNPGIRTVGMRIPANAFSRKLVQAFGRPITTTSANISGQPSPYSVSAIEKPDLILNSGRLKKNPPSTILDLSGQKPRVLRQGSATLSLVSL